MFDPTKLVSPWQSVMKALDAKDPIYKLMLDKYNTIVNRVEYQNKRTNSIATCTQVDAVTGKPFTRQIEYDRLDIGEWSKQNTTEYVDKFGVKRRSLISGNVNKSLVDVTVPILTSTLYSDHGILISEADLTFGEARAYEPVNTDFGTAYYLVNCTIYGDVVTYTDGNVVTNHLNVGRSTLLPTDSDLKVGFSLVRSPQEGETIQIKLPHVGGSDKWSLLIESVDNLVNTTAGVLWLKIELSSVGQHWDVFDANGLVTKLDATTVNPLTIETIEGAMVLRGKAESGEVQDFYFETSVPVIESTLQRITAYSNNPFASTFQFEMNTTGTEVPQEPAVSIVKNNTIFAHPLSNALTGRIDVPMTLTDLRADNYIEHTQDTYRPKSSNVFDRGSVDRVAMLDNNTLLTCVVKITDFPNLVKSNKISKVVFDSYSIVNNGYDYGERTYEILAVDSVNETMHLVVRDRGVIVGEYMTAALPTTDTFTAETSNSYSALMFNDIVWPTTTPTNDTSLTVTKQQNLKVTVHMKTPTVLPEIVYTKTITTDKGDR